METVDLILQASGWIGAFLILYGYYLISHRKVTSASTKYQTMNLLGSLLLIATLYGTNAYYAVFLNATWAILAISSLMHHRRK